jgi:hypothetical protein
MTKDEAIKLQRELAIRANFFDNLIRIPFTNQGVGADAATGTFPIFGDITGLLMAAYAICKARQLGVPMDKLLPAVSWAVADVAVGLVPGVGDVADVFIRPSKRAVLEVNRYLSTEYGITESAHIEHPWMYALLEKLQRRGTIWHRPALKWLVLHLPDIFFSMFLLYCIYWIYHLYSVILGFFGFS